MIEIAISRSVGVMTLCRPEARNALSRALIASMTSQLERLQADPNIKVMFDLKPVGVQFYLSEYVSDQKEKYFALQEFRFPL